MYKVIIHENKNVDEGWLDGLKQTAGDVASDIKAYTGKKIQGAKVASFKADLAKLAARATEIGASQEVIQALQSASQKFNTIGQTQTEPAQAATQQTQTDSTAPKPVPTPQELAAGQAAAQKALGIKQNDSNVEEKLHPVTNQIFDNLKSSIRDAYRSGNESMANTDEETVLKKYKTHINNALNNKTLEPINNLTKQLNIRDAAKNLVSQFIDNNQQELEESKPKKTFKIKIGESNC